jgi:uncharacterized protein Yka (UPF0111/DUF47 family)
MMPELPVLTPEDERFVGLFAYHIQAAIVCSNSLLSIVGHDDSLLRHLDIIDEQEREADRITREVLTSLRRSQLSYFSYADIRELATSTDNAIGHMKRAANLVRLFGTRNVDPGMRNMANAVHQCTALVQTAASLLSPSAALDGGADSINTQITLLKEQISAIYDTGIKDLYEAHSLKAIAPVFAKIKVYHVLDDAAEQLFRVAKTLYYVVIGSMRLSPIGPPDFSTD